jgi:uncharacterized membrane protein
MSGRPSTRVRSEGAAILIVFLAGLILRVRQFLAGRSLWLDEAMLALNIVKRGFADLFKPLEYDQGAPIGFLLVEKIFNLFLGRNEYALRLFPLILGLLSLWLFYLLLKRFTRETSLILALALFAFNPYLIYYSSEVKQYISDVFVAISLLLIATHYFERPSRKGLGILTLAGLFALWLSHPSLFILAGIGATLFLLHLRKRDFASLRLVTGMGVAWLANTGLLYALTLANLRNNSFMKEYWREAFAPMPPWSNIGWYWEAFRGNADSLLAVTFAPLLLLFVMLAGLASLYKQKRHSAAVIAWMLAFTVLASSLGLYPSSERMVLFLAPVMILLIGVALGYVIQTLRGRPVISTTVTLFAGIYLFYGALPLTVEHFISPKYFEHIRPTMEYLRGAWKEGDKLYVSSGGAPAFEYYAPMYGLEDIDYTAGEREDYDNHDRMIQRLAALKGRGRVWVLFSHVYEREGFNEHDFLFEYLKENGTRRRAFVEPGTSVYLYLFDLNE